MGLYITVVGDEALAARFSNTPARQAIIAREIDGELAAIQAILVPLTPVGVTSALRGSWGSYLAGLTGVLGSPLVYSEVIERGRRPGARMPPPDALATWVARKMGPDVDSFVVARSIGRKGIKARRMLARAQAASLPQRLAMRRAAFARLLEASG